MNCAVCGKRIPKARLAMNPRVKTCSHPCSKEHTRMLQRLAQDKRQERIKAQRAAAGNPVKQYQLRPRDQLKRRA